ncbi:AaceriAGR131Wp [[Ashbya] aceris (nom. inval.)]|nr:AaceriAGR131Wp [[Ashbya] aceris (nom. inval.)]
MDPPTALQYKLQLLLHINTLLIVRSAMLRPGHPQLDGLPPDQLEDLLRQYIRRVHSNLQCISAINQGNPRARPQIMDPPPLPPPLQHPQQDILPKLYVLLAKLFDVS